MTKAQRIRELLARTAPRKLENAEIASIVSKEFGKLVRPEYVRAVQQRLLGGGESVADRHYREQEEKERTKKTGWVRHPRGKNRLNELSERFG